MAGRGLTGELSPQFTLAISTGQRNQLTGRKSTALTLQMAMKTPP